MSTAQAVNFAPSIASLSKRWFGRRLCSGIMAQVLRPHIHAIGYPVMSVPKYALRPATENDLPSILDIYGQTGLDDGVRLELPVARELFAGLARYPYYRIFVVTDADANVRATYALLIMDNLAHVGAPLAIVEQVAVSSSQQGLGIGRLMMGHAMAQARAQGCYKLALSSNVKREQAHDFYDKLGFVRHGYSFVMHLVQGGEREEFAG